MAALLGQSETAFAEDDRRLLSAVLLMEVALVDGRLRPEETDSIRRFLVEAFDLDGPTADALLAEADRRARAADDPLDAASLARRLFAPEQKRDLVAALWAVAKADGRIHEFEEGLIERVSVALGG